MPELPALHFYVGLGAPWRICSSRKPPFSEFRLAPDLFQAGASSSEWIVTGSLLIVYHLACKKRLLALVTFVGFVHPDCCLHDLLC